MGAVEELRRERRSGGVNRGSSTPTTIAPVLEGHWLIQEGITQRPCRAQKSEVRRQPADEGAGVEWVRMEECKCLCVCALLWLC